MKRERAGIGCEFVRPDYPWECGPRKSVGERTFYEGIQPRRAEISLKGLLQDNHERELRSNHRTVYPGQGQGIATGARAIPDAGVSKRTGIARASQFSPSRPRCR